VIEIVNTQSFQKKVIEASKPVVIDVWAPWCNPCKAMAPHFEAVSEEYGAQAKFLKLNADENANLVRDYKIMGIPTLLYFNHGKLLARKTGIQKKTAIQNRLQKVMEMSADDALAREITGAFGKPELNLSTILLIIGALVAVGGVLFNVLR